MSIALLMFAETLTLRGIFPPKVYINFASISRCNKKGSPRRRAGAKRLSGQGCCPEKAYFNCSAVWQSAATVWPSTA